MSTQIVSKIIFALMTLVSARGLAIQEIRCEDAGGFYGNIRLMQTDKGYRTKILAAQGYAHEISVQLGAKPGREASDLSIEFESKQCLMQTRGIRCQGKVIVNPSQYNKNQEGFAANVDFTLVTEVSATNAQLTIQPLNSSVIAQASHVFKAPMGSCLRR